MVSDEVVVAFTGALRYVATAGVATRVEVVAAEDEAAAPVVPAVVATAAVADLLAAAGDATGGATSGRRAPLRRATSSPSVLGVWVLATRRACSRRIWRC